MLDVETRQAALDNLLKRLGKGLTEVRIDPTRTLLQDGERLWTIVSVASAASADSASLRRGGAKHKQVRN